ncbi:hypothetical protein TPA0598_10_00620 [Streptomyces lydicamycinicus]|uniref:Uncharacterized protein n=1 Tax=Streptomyces lydicamycinicus TaxID=1546107 RepID=A0A0P4RFR3_9ACTN|nr:hypothetical protein TPA0598_10_00620 [Streptomyces lydicamycinicus]
MYAAGLRAAQARKALPRPLPLLPLRGRGRGWVRGWGGGVGPDLRPPRAKWGRGGRWARTVLRAARRTPHAASLVTGRAAAERRP